MKINLEMIILGLLYLIVAVDFCAWSVYYLKSRDLFKEIDKKSKMLINILGVCIASLYVLIILFIIPSTVIWTAVKFIVLIAMGYIGANSIKTIKYVFTCYENTISDDEFYGIDEDADDECAYFNEDYNNSIMNVGDTRKIYIEKYDDSFEAECIGIEKDANLSYLYTFEIEVDGYSERTELYEGEFYITK